MNKRFMTVDKVNFAWGDGSQVLSDISFDLYENEFVTLLGPNGCGKTTLLRIIAGELAASSGAIKILTGETLEERKFAGGNFNKNIGFVRQRVKLFPWLNAKDNIMFGPKRLRADRRRRQELLDKIATAFGFSEKILSQYPRELSGGWRQRVSIAQVLANEPELVLLDEPFSALDPRARSNMSALLENVRASMKITLLQVTHDIPEALASSDRLLLMLGSHEHPAKIVGEFDIKEKIRASPLEAQRLRRAISTLFASKENEITTRDVALKMESAMVSGDRVYIVGLEPEREYEESDFFRVVCQNIKDGVVYHYIFPDYYGYADSDWRVGEMSLPPNIVSLLEAISKNTRVHAGDLSKYVRISVAPKKDIFDLSGDCVILEPKGGACEGWYFPVNLNYNFMFRFSGIQLDETGRLVQEWANGRHSSRLLFP